MRFHWMDYHDKYAALIDSWLDETARRYTGCDDGWDSFYQYWVNSGDMALNNNFWCKIIWDGDMPFAVIAFSAEDDTYTIMEYVVAPDVRGKGVGARALCELLENGREILGQDIQRAQAVIYPANTASKKAFEKAGFVWDHTHPDGDAEIYIYKKIL